MVPIKATDFRELWKEPLATRIERLRPGTLRIGYFYEVPDSGSFRYRAYNMAQTLNSFSQTLSASYFFLSDLPLIEKFTDFLDVAVLVRFRFSGVLSRLIDQFRAANRPVLFDIDDLLFDVKHAPIVAATLDFGLDPGQVLDNWYSLATRLHHTLSLCDAAITTTETLAREIRTTQGLQATVIPNFLNLEQLRASESHADQNLNAKDTGFTIGYFSGSKSHARDFEIATRGIKEFLKLHPDARLVVAGILEIPEALHDCESQITRVPFMDYVTLQTAVARVDVNIAPLQENLFTDSKSELKFFEAGIVQTPTIASPTEVYRRVIDDGVNGFLSSAADWLDTLEGVRELPLAKRHAIAVAARTAALTSYTGEAHLTAIEQTLSKVAT